MTTKKKTTKTTKKKVSVPAAALLDGVVTLNTGKEPETYELTHYDDLPRRVRRQLKNSLFKAAPAPDSVTGKEDIYLAAYDAGLILLKHAGARINPDDESLPDADADVVDQVVLAAGLRVLGQMNPTKDEEAGGAPNADEASDETT